VWGAVDLEHEYAADCLPNGVLGLNAEGIREYIEYIAGRRLEKISLPKIYGAQNPFPWMSEVIDLRKKKNFFETRVTESKTGGALSWDD
jgi:ribonucleoside-diphosphate reductase beta chain